MLFHVAPTGGHGERRCVFELATFCKMHQRDLRGKLLLLSLDWSSSLNPFHSGRLTSAERAYFVDFSCLKLQCTKPADRAFVLAQVVSFPCTSPAPAVRACQLVSPTAPVEQVREKWGSEDEFDAFVRNELPELLETGKRRYFGQPWRVLANAFDALFGFT